MSQEHQPPKSSPSRKESDAALQSIEPDSIPQLAGLGMLRLPDDTGPGSGREIQRPDREYQETASDEVAEEDPGVGRELALGVEHGVEHGDGDLEVLELSPAETHSPASSPLALLAGDAPGGRHLTERQLVWVSHRLSLADDLEACVAAQVEPDEVIEWRKDAGFAELIQSSLLDKRGHYRPLTENLLPLAIRTLYDMLANGSDRQKEKALTQIHRIQGLFVDTIRHEDPAALSQLLDKLRTPVPVEVIDIEPRR